MQESSLSSQQLLTSYVGELNDVKVQQIRLYTQWTEYGYSSQFDHFLSKQKREVSEQHAVLKSLIDTLKIHELNEARSSIRNLLYEAEQIERYARHEGGLEAVEPLIVQLLQGVKHHEMVMVRGAITLARTLKEPAIIDSLVGILEEQEQAYLWLRDFEANRVEAEQK